MTIPEFSQQTTSPNIVKNGPISSDELRSFTEAAVLDINALSTLINDTMLPIFRSIPMGDGIDPIQNGLDGKSIFVDGQASTIKDNGLFFNINENRPLLVYEIMMLFVKLIANIHNGLKEGLSIGSITAPVEILNSEFVDYTWQYFDAAFDSYLFSISTNTVTKIDPLISVNYLNKTIRITNNTGSTINIFGYIWHPVFSFQ